jgi:hypothetical protein
MHLDIYIYIYKLIYLEKSKRLLPSSQIISCFNFSRFVNFAMHLNIINISRCIEKNSTDIKYQC